MRGKCVYVCFSLISHPFHPCPVLTLPVHINMMLLLQRPASSCLLICTVCSLYSKVLGLGEEDVRAVKQELNPMQGRVFMCDWYEKANKDIHNTILGAVAVSGIGMVDFKTQLCPSVAWNRKGPVPAALGPRVENLGNLQAKSNHTISVLKWEAL